MSQIGKGQRKLKANRKRIFKIDSDVMKNKAAIYVSRSIIEENRFMILSNYAATFVGNRQVANSNTDEILSSRNAILSNLEVETPNEQKFVEVQKEKAALDFLNHRSQLNAAVLTISEEMSDINMRLMDINQRIMESNQLIIDFNAEQIELNSRFLQGKVDIKKASLKETERLNSENLDLISGLETRTKLNGDRIIELTKKSLDKTGMLTKAKNKILKNRASILSNREKIMKSKSKIF